MKPKAAITRAAVLQTINQPLVIEELEIPELTEGQVLIKVLYSGICHSQLNEIKGLKGEDKFLPHLLGHEGSGVVEEIGPGVTKVKPGDYVVLSWIKGKGKEAPSSRYKKGNVVINSGAISTFSKYAVISENRLFPIDRKIPPPVAALLGCAIPTGAGIIRNEIESRISDECQTSDKGDKDNANGKHDQKHGPNKNQSLTPNQASIAIFGIGGIGASALLYASTMLYSKIIAVDINEEKLRFARNIGATHTINVSQEDPIARIREITERKGVDYSVECSGSKIAMESAFQCLTNSGFAIIAGNLKKGERIQIDPFDLILGKKITGTWGGRTNPDLDIPYYAEKIVRNSFDFAKLITKIYPFDDINLAFDDLEKGKVIRALIECQ